uniref:Uncharacterized protein LOC116956420 n=1 Tax=Petromyzon marinus TaxID=7757 RepID=A0AAJ7UCS2_PETMA|nr:uncharacterized protein LOC116956420 [Petromyzon marinus]
MDRPVRSPRVWLLVTSALLTWGDVSSLSSPSLPDVRDLRQTAALQDGYSLAWGVPQGVPQEVPQEVPQGVPQGVSQGVPQEVPQGVPHAASFSVSINGITVATALTEPRYSVRGLSACVRQRVHVTMARDDGSESPGETILAHTAPGPLLGAFLQRFPGGAVAWWRCAVRADSVQLQLLLLRDGDGTEGAEEQEEEEEEEAPSPTAVASAPPERCHVELGAVATACSPARFSLHAVCGGWPGPAHSWDSLTGPGPLGPLSVRGPDADGAVAASWAPRAGPASRVSGGRPRATLRRGRGGPGATTALRGLRPGASYELRAHEECGGLRGPTSSVFFRTGSAHTELDPYDAVLLPRGGAGARPSPSPAAPASLGLEPSPPPRPPGGAGAAEAVSKPRSSTSSTSSVSSSSSYSAVLVVEQHRVANASGQLRPSVNGSAQDFHHDVRTSGREPQLSVNASAGGPLLNVTSVEGPRLNVTSARGPHLALNISTTAPRLTVTSTGAPRLSPNTSTGGPRLAPTSVRELGVHKTSTVGPRLSKTSAREPRLEVTSTRGPRLSASASTWGPGIAVTPTRGPRLSVSASTRGPGMAVTSTRGPRLSASASTRGPGMAVTSTRGPRLSASASTRGPGMAVTPTRGPRLSASTSTRRPGMAVTPARGLGEVGGGGTLGVVVGRVEEVEEAARGRGHVVVIFPWVLDDFLREPGSAASRAFSSAVGLKFSEFVAAGAGGVAPERLLVAVVGISRVLLGGDDDDDEQEEEEAVAATLSVRLRAADNRSESAVPPGTVLAWARRPLASSPSFAVLRGRLTWTGTSACHGAALRGVAPCGTLGSVCVNALPGRACACGPRLYDIGDLYGERPGSRCVEHGMRVYCEPRSVAVRVSAAFVREHAPSAAPPRLRLLDPRCGGPVDEGTYLFFNVTGGLGSCGGTATVNETHVLYENTVLVMDEDDEGGAEGEGRRSTGTPPLVSRGSLALRWACVYPRSYRTTLGYALSDGAWARGAPPSASPAAATVLVGHGAGVKVRLAMSLYRSAAFAPGDALAPPGTGPLPVALSGSLHLEVRAQLLGSAFGEEPLTLALLACWATGTPSADDPVSVELIHGGCARDETLRWHGENGRALWSRFSVAMFHFARRETAPLHLHCRVRVCGASARGRCLLTCPAKRSSANREGSTPDADPRAGGPEDRAGRGLAAAAGVRHAHPGPTEVGGSPRGPPTRRRVAVDTTLSLGPILLVRAGEGGGATGPVGVVTDGARPWAGPVVVVVAVASLLSVVALLAATSLLLRRLLRPRLELHREANRTARRLAPPPPPRGAEGAGGHPRRVRGAARPPPTLAGDRGNTFS